MTGYSKVDDYCQSKSQGKLVKEARFEVRYVMPKKAFEKLKTYKDMAKLNEKLYELTIALCNIESELSNIETAGRRTKARMVRELLGKSDQGQKLLKMLPKIDSKLLNA